MKHLMMIIKKLYPERMFSLKEVYETDEVYNCYVEYQLWIEDRASEYFHDFQDLEDYVYNLYKEETWHQAEDILNKRRDK